MNALPIQKQREPANGQFFVALLVGAELRETKAFREACAGVGVEVKYAWRPEDGVSWRVPDDVEIVLLMPGSTASHVMRQRSAFIQREMTKRAVFDARAPSNAIAVLRKTGFVARPIAATPTVIEPPPPLAVVREPEPEPEPEPEREPEHEPKPSTPTTHESETRMGTSKTNAHRTNAIANGKLIAAGLEKHGLTRRQAAELIGSGLTTAHLGNLLSGSSLPRPALASRIETALQLKPNSLFRSLQGDAPDANTSAKRGRAPRAPRAERVTSAPVLQVAPRAPLTRDGASREDAMIAMMRIQAMLAELGGVASLEIRATVGEYNFEISDDEIKVRRA